MNEEAIIAAEIMAQERNWAVPIKTMKTETPEAMQQTTVNKQKSANAKSYWARMTREERSAENKRRAALARAKKRKSTFHPHTSNPQAMADLIALSQKGEEPPQSMADLIALRQRMEQEAFAETVAKLGQMPPPQGLDQEATAAKAYAGQPIGTVGGINPVTPLAALKAEYRRRITLIEEVETWLP